MAKFEREIALYEKLHAIRTELNLPAETDMIALLRRFRDLITPPSGSLAVELKTELRGKLFEILNVLPLDQAIPAIKEAVSAAGLEAIPSAQAVARKVYREMDFEYHRPTEPGWTRRLPAPPRHPPTMAATVPPNSLFR